MSTGGTAPPLHTFPADLIGGHWRPLDRPTGGERIESRNPAKPRDVIWSGWSNPGHIDAAVASARAALGPWASLPATQRFSVLRRFAGLCKANETRVADLICDETGKPLWEAAAEASLLSAKVDITLESGPNSGLSRTSEFEFAISSTRSGRCMFKPHGVMAVIGPFNFPAHLPNGHIVPALAMGNTVVFKPSDKAPAVGQALASLLAGAIDAEHIPGLPPGGGGVVNLVQGGAGTATTLVSHPDLDGILFTGSWPVGRRILEANLDHPGRIVALELGGSNPAVVMPDADLKQAAIEITRCAFNTAGQRCTSTRRLIVHHDVADALLNAVVHAAQALRIGDPRSTSPVFMGPMISAAARDAVIAFQDEARRSGAKILLEARTIPDALGGFYISPGILEVASFSEEDSSAAVMHAGCDREIFGPLLRVCRVNSLDEALSQANATRYGLSASLFTRDDASRRRFAAECRAGCINFNTGTAGASSKLPFGGLGLSGNHRPAGSFSLDYCAYPVATMVETGAAATLSPGMRFDPDWIS